VQSATSTGANICDHPICNGDHRSWFFALGMSAFSLGMSAFPVGATAS